MATSGNKQNAEVKLKRFLYLSSEDSRYITGNAEQHNYYETSKITSIKEILESSNPDILLNIIEIVNSENMLTRRETLFIALAIAGTKYNLSTELKHKLFVTATNIIKSMEELFIFIKFYTKLKKNFPSAVNKLISRYYLSLDPMILAEEISKVNGYHGWKHKDLLKLCHCKSSNILTTIVINYVLHGYKKAQGQAENNQDSTQIIEYLSKVEELKNCENEKRIVQLISELHCDLKRIPSFFHKSLPIWEALISEIGLRDLLKSLPKLYRLGFIKANTNFQTKLLERLTNTEQISSSKIHPVEVYIALKNFEKGGKPLDPKLKIYLSDKAEPSSIPDNEFCREPIKCGPVTNALQKALQASYQNVSSTGKRFMFTVDLSDKMNESCLLNKNVSCLEASIITIVSFLKVEKEVTVAVFNDCKVYLVSMDKNMTLPQALAKLKQAKSGFVMPTSPFEWAAQKKKIIDVFVNIHSHFWFCSVPKDIKEKFRSLEPHFNKYKKKVSSPNSKLISVCFGSPIMAMSDGSPNFLDICGFDEQVPKVIEAFARGLFC